MLLIHRAFPGNYRLEIYPFEEGDPQFEMVLENGERHKMGLSLEQFRNTLDGEEGVVAGPNGEKYRVSLADLADRDPQKTYLHQVFGFAPKIPFHVDPRLEETMRNNVTTPPAPPKMYLAVDKSAPPKMQVKPGAAPPLLPQRQRFIHCSDVRYEHKLTLVEGDASRNLGQPASVMLNIAEATAEYIECPACDAKVTMWEPLKKRMEQLIKEIGEEDPWLDLRFAHPSHLPATKTPAPDAPVKLSLYYLYTPFETPPIIEVPDAERLLTLYSNRHALVIRAVPATQMGQPGVKLAGDWLKTGLDKAPELDCSLCETKLKLDTPLDEYLQTLTEAEGGPDKAYLEWCILHPEDLNSREGQSGPEFRVVSMPHQRFFGNEEVPHRFPQMNNRNFDVIHPAHNSAAQITVWENRPGLALVATANQG